MDLNNGDKVEITPGSMRSSAAAVFLFAFSCRSVAGLLGRWVARSLGRSSQVNWEPQSHRTAWIAAAPPIGLMEMETACPKKQAPFAWMGTKPPKLQTSFRRPTADV